MSRAPEFDEATQERASLHALGLLAPEEAADFEREIWTKPGLRELVEEMRVGLEQVARAEAIHQPPPDLRAALLEQVAQRTPSKSPIPFGTVSRQTLAVPAAPRTYGWVPWAVAAGLAVSAGLSFFQASSARSATSDALAQVKKLTDQLSHTKTQLADAQTQALVATKRVAELEAEGGKMRADNSRLAAETTKAVERMRVAALTRTPAAGASATAIAYVVWDKQQKNGFLNIKGLPPAPPGKDYQLWAIDNRQPAPVSAGTFVTQPDGTAQVFFKPADPQMRCDKFAVSLEPAGGGNAPAGPVFLVGS